jgi:NADH-quinone oxidoreductase subunit D/NADH-quinone oxidoreductase subunit C/D
MSDAVLTPPEERFATPAEEANARLKEAFPELADDNRPNHTGLMVSAENLLAVATTLRDDLGFDYLSSVTGLDLLDENRLEVVYHLYSIEKGGGPVTLKVQVPRDSETPTVPSLTPMWPGADFQEREAWDLYGIRFEGHPDLRRILMWEEFEGFPMRKDWKEVFYEEDHKPFGSRWPGGNVVRMEELNRYGKNVRYPAGWQPTGDEYDVETNMYGLVQKGRSDTPGLRTDKVTVNIGPQHPSTHGVFRMVVTLDGETVLALKPVMGYLHRNHEKIGERNTFIQNIPYTDRLDYLSSMNNNHAYVMAVEKLLGMKVAERAEWIRILMAELSRIANHGWALGFYINDLGAFQTPMLYLYIERELILDFFEATSGARMMCNYMRFGGVAYDLPTEVRGQETMQFLHDLVYERLPVALDDFDKLITRNEIVTARSRGVGVLTREEAIAYSTAGPLLRASGVAYDIRRAEPYSFYESLDFDIPVEYDGDLYARFLVRFAEIHQSIRIIKQVLPYLAQTAGAPIIEGKPQYAIRAPKTADCYSRAENPKGELGFYLKVKAKESNLDRYHIRAPSFINLTGLEKMSIGHKVADLVAVLGSIDIVLGEVDR